MVRGAPASPGNRRVSTNTAGTATVYNALAVEYSAAAAQTTFPTQLPRNEPRYWRGLVAAPAMTGPRVQRITIARQVDDEVNEAQMRALFDEYTNDLKRALRDEQSTYRDLVAIQFEATDRRLQGIDTTLERLNATLGELAVTVGRLQVSVDSIDDKIGAKIWKYMLGGFGFLGLLIAILELFVK